mmetsp:Transcript_2082/g.2898  ORF Transcript_2082/g.2898 Transcript_2082/m.2898 type:complete len:114 (+) Transcript_2082:300-641(+)
MQIKFIITSNIPKSSRNPTLQKPSVTSNTDVVTRNPKVLKIAIEENTIFLTTPTSVDSLKLDWKIGRISNAKHPKLTAKSMHATISPATQPSVRKGIKVKRRTTHIRDPSLTS